MPPVRALTQTARSGVERIIHEPSTLLTIFQFNSKKYSAYSTPVTLRPAKYSLGITISMPIYNLGIKFRRETNGNDNNLRAEFSSFN